ncbi:hypothetical protein ATANTOWER_021680 [Ataeniobius toweri]|uniref:Uncharacterized protein n=1 Tax=Ataeniobius toweri TaxID=208326 RepID=A0ABU7B521_9TELE|nr:hypothetical protein [Ataeniobius toweri]
MGWKASWLHEASSHHHFPKGESPSAVVFFLTLSVCYIIMEEFCSTMCQFIETSAQLSEGLTTSVNQSEVRPLTGPLQHSDPCFFKPFCYRSAAMFGIIALLVTQFGPSFSCWSTQ